MSETINAEIISVGTELLLGHVTNTDAKDVSEMLSQIGVNVLFHTTVGDNPARIKNCVEIAKTRVNLIITTGGLGPTCDDLTKRIISEAFGLFLVRDEAEYNYLNERVISRKQVLTDNIFDQALLPEGCSIFHNNAGTAPGCAFEKDGVTVIMLPGPPHECRQMLIDSVIPYLKKKSNDVIVSHSIRIFGKSESAVDDIFRDEMNALSNPTMAPYAQQCDCYIKLTAKAKSVEEGENMLKPLMEHVMSELGDVVYGIDVMNLEERLIQLLEQNNKTISIIDFYTGGDISARFCRLPNYSKFLNGAEVKNECSNLRAAALDIRNKFSSDIGIAISCDDRILSVAISAVDYDLSKTFDIGINKTRGYRVTICGNYAFDEIRRYLCKI